MGNSLGRTRLFEAIVVYVRTHSRLKQNIGPVCEANSLNMTE